MSAFSDPHVALGLYAALGEEIVRDSIDLVITQGAEQLVANEMERQLPAYTAQSFLFDVDRVVRLQNVARDAGDAAPESLNKVWTAEPGPTVNQIQNQFTECDVTHHSYPLPQPNPISAPLDSNIDLIPSLASVE